MAEFTAREMEIMSHAWNCMTEEPKVDYEKLASLCNMTNPRSAGNAWRLIKQKIMAKGPGENQANGDGTTTPVKKTPGKKRGAKKNADDDDEGTPPKKPRSARKQKEASPAVSDISTLSDLMLQTPVKKEKADRGEIKEEKAGRGEIKKEKQVDDGDAEHDNEDAEHDNEDAEHDNEDEDEKSSDV